MQESDTEAQLIGPTGLEDRRSSGPESAQAGRIAPDEVACNVVPGTALPWRPRLDASHLRRGAGGIWYFRLAIPERVRAGNPALPTELNRSTRTGERRLALTRARQMCLEFLVGYNNFAKPMQASDSARGQASFSIEYVDGAIRTTYAPNASAETLILLSRVVGS